MDNSTPSTMMSPPKKRSSDLDNLSSNEKQCILNMYKQQLIDEPDKKSPWLYLKFPRHLVKNDEPRKDVRNPDEWNTPPEDSDDGVVSGEEESGQGIAGPSGRDCSIAAAESGKSESPKSQQLRATEHDSEERCQTEHESSQTGSSRNNELGNNEDKYGDRRIYEEREQPHLLRSRGESEQELQQRSIEESESTYAVQCGSSYSSDSNVFESSSESPEKNSQQSYISQYDIGRSHASAEDLHQFMPGRDHKPAVPTKAEILAPRSIKGGNNGNSARNKYGHLRRFSSAENLKEIMTARLSHKASERMEEILPPYTATGGNEDMPEQVTEEECMINIALSLDIKHQARDKEANDQDLIVADNQDAHDPEISSKEPTGDNDAHYAGLSVPEPTIEAQCSNNDTSNLRIESRNSTDAVNNHDLHTLAQSGKQQTVEVLEQDSPAPKSTVGRDDRNDNTFEASVEDKGSKQAKNDYAPGQVLQDRNIAAANKELLAPERVDEDNTSQPVVLEPVEGNDAPGQGLSAPALVVQEQRRNLDVPAQNPLAPNVRDEQDHRHANALDQGLPAGEQGRNNSSKSSSRRSSLYSDSATSSHTSVSTTSSSSGADGVAEPPQDVVHEERRPRVPVVQDEAEMNFRDIEIHVEEVDVAGFDDNMLQVHQQNGMLNQEHHMNGIRRDVFMPFQGHNGENGYQLANLDLLQIPVPLADQQLRAHFPGDQENPNLPLLDVDLNDLLLRVVDQPNNEYDDDQQDVRGNGAVLLILSDDISSCEGSRAGDPDESRQEVSDAESQNITADRADEAQDEVDHVLPEPDVDMRDSVSRAESQNVTAYDDNNGAQGEVVQVSPEPDIDLREDVSGTQSQNVAAYEDNNEAQNEVDLVSPEPDVDLREDTSDVELRNVTAAEDLNDEDDNEAQDEVNRASPDPKSLPHVNMRDDVSHSESQNVTADEDNNGAHGEVVLVLPEPDVALREDVSGAQSQNVAAYEDNNEAQDEVDLVSPEPDVVPKEDASDVELRNVRAAEDLNDEDDNEVQDEVNRVSPDSKSLPHVNIRDDVSHSESQNVTADEDNNGAQGEGILISPEPDIDLKEGAGGAESQNVAAYEDNNEAQDEVDLVSPEPDVDLREDASDVELRNVTAAEDLNDEDDDGTQDEVNRVSPDPKSLPLVNMRDDVSHSESQKVTADEDNNGAQGEVVVVSPEPDIELKEDVSGAQSQNVAAYEDNNEAQDEVDLASPEPDVDLREDASDVELRNVTAAEDLSDEDDNESQDEVNRVSPDPKSLPHVNMRDDVSHCESQNVTADEDNNGAQGEVVVVSPEPDIELKEDVSGAQSQNVAAYEDNNEAQVEVDLVSPEPDVDLREDASDVELLNVTAAEDLNRVSPDPKSLPHVANRLTEEEAMSIRRILLPEKVTVFLRETDYERLQYLPPLLSMGLPCVVEDIYYIPYKEVIQETNIIFLYFLDHTAREAGFPHLVQVSSKLNPAFGPTITRFNREWHRYNQHHYVEQIHIQADDIDLEVLSFDAYRNMLISFFPRDLVTWRRTLSMFVFSTRVAMRLLRSGRKQRIFPWYHWTVLFLTHHLAPWVYAQGGWRNVEPIPKPSKVVPALLGGVFALAVLAGMALFRQHL